MFKRKTVFIIGAGVSSVFQFPLGSRLVDEILSARGQQAMDQEYQWIPAAGGDQQTLRAIMGALFDAKPASIDAFLEHRLALQDTGKLLIAYHIGRREIPSALSSQKDCLQLILNKMTENCPSPNVRTNQVAFVTFNYDRSLEHYFHAAFKARYGLNDSDAAAWLREIPIIHPYGQLGYLPWQKEMLGQSESQRELLVPDIGIRAYEPMMTADKIMIAAAGIEIISKAKPDSVALRMARRLIKDAELVIALGFGYHPENMSRLGLDRTEQGDPIKRPIRGTSYKLTGAEQQAFAKRYPISFPVPGLCAYDFLRNLEEFVQM